MAQMAGKMNIMAKTYSELLAEIQPQIITNDEQNDVFLAHIERLWHIENRTPEEEKLFDLLLLLSEHFEDKAYPMESSWLDRMIYRIQAFIFRW
jgi:HTH-type transcriptional regulator/antitoxin HigA